MITSDILIEDLDEAYRRPSAATEEIARTDGDLAEHVGRNRPHNAEAILEARNGRTANLYLDGLLDTDEHRRPEAERARADLALQHSRRKGDKRESRYLG